MLKNTELNYQSFIEIIKTELSNFFGDIIVSGERELKVNISKTMCMKINTNEVWKQYEQSGNIEVLSDFIQTQSDILMSLDPLEKSSFGDIKKHLIPSIRSTEFLKQMKAEGHIIQKEIGKDLMSVILYDQERYTQLVNKELYPSLPNDKEVFKIAKENLLSRGWVGETHKFSEIPFDMFIFEERKHNSHYQFFIKEWVDTHIGDCYIAFPTNKIALVLKLKSDDWKDWIRCINFFNNTVSKTYNEEAYPLSKNIIKYENGVYDIL